MISHDHEMAVTQTVGGRVFLLVLETEDLLDVRVISVFLLIWSKLVLEH